MKTQKLKITLITCLVLTLMLFSIFSFLIFNNLKVFSNIPTDTNITNINNNSSQSEPYKNDSDQNPSNLNNNNSNTNDDAQDDAQNENSKITNTSTCVSVGEIWNDTLKQFDGANLLQLIKYASNSTITLDDISAIKNRIVTANTMRSYNGSKDILVTLGGLQWTVTYLSQDKNGNPILTLWLANTLDTSTWTSGFTGARSPNSAYPDNMYGTSYIRAVTLNNGGYYLTARNVLSSSPAVKSSTHKYSKFTITTTYKTNIADYLVAPAYVEWQRIQKLIDTNHGFNCLANEGWALNQSSSNYATNSEGNYNYSLKNKYDSWKDDLLWLPSFNEVGNNSCCTGVWKASSNQNQNNDKYSWLRTSHNSENVSIYVSPQKALNGTNPSTSLAVRPALHINLTTAVASVKDIWSYTNFFSYNLNRVLKYLYGTNTAATNDSLLSSISSTIGSGALNSNQIKAKASLVTDKTFLNSNNELLIAFGGLSWYATFLTKNTSGQIILTMWLSDSGQLYNKGKQGTDGSIKYNVYGSSSWNSGSPPYSDGTSAISNNYGNSNIRTSYFSSATTNTASVFNSYLKTSSNYTAIGDFIVAPKDLNTQDTLNLQKTQTAKSTLGFRYNLPNESYSNLINYSNPYKNLSLSASTTNYTTWQNDKLWLPSLSEVGLGLNNIISTNSTASNNLRTAGLWGLSTAQRSNTNKTATWLRSGHITDKNLAYTISSDGLDYGYTSLNAQNAIRPALHLNLTLACQYAS